MRDGRENVSRPVGFVRWDTDHVILVPANKKDGVCRELTEVEATAAFGARSVAAFKAEPNVWFSLYPNTKLREKEIPHGENDTP